MKLQIATGTTCNTSIGVPPYYQNRFQELRALRLTPPAVGRDLFFLTATPGVLVARGGFSKKVVLAFVTCQGGSTHAAPRGPMHVLQDAHALTNSTFAHDALVCLANNQLEAVCLGVVRPVHCSKLASLVHFDQLVASL